MAHPTFRLAAGRILVAGLLATALAAGPAVAADWGFVTPLVTEALADGAMPLGDPYWFPDAETPEAATRAVGVLYVEIPGAAGNFNIAAGVFGPSGGSWTLQAPIRDLFGTDPRDPRWEAGKLTLTTTMPKEGDPRCCPTGEAHWSIDLKTGGVTELD